MNNFLTYLKTASALRKELEVSRIERDAYIREADMRAHLAHQRAEVFEAQVKDLKQRIMAVLDSHLGVPPKQAPDV